MPSSFTKAVGLGLVIFLATAVSASATFHRMSVREVYPGSASQPNAEYVELEMWAGGQNLVGGHLLRTYNASGAEIKANPFPGDVSRGTSQSTILMATPEAESQFGVTADGAFSTVGQLDPAGGAVCWESIDCVSWGNFSGALPSPAGSPAEPSGIPDGLALRRTIAPGCPTELDSGDDSDSSSVDFFAAAPEPLPNSVPPMHTCTPGPGQGGTGPGGSKSGSGAPQTTLRVKPPHRTHDRTPTFRFVADERGATFQCKLDGKRYRSCRSPFTARKLSLGRHVFRVRARDDSGKLDPSPASYSFEVLLSR